MNPYTTNAQVIIVPSGGPSNITTLALMAGSLYFGYKLGVKQTEPEAVTEKKEKETKAKKAAAMSYIKTRFGGDN